LIVEPLDILVFRDPREQLAKCSLTPLRGKPGIRFVDYHPEIELDPGERILLHIDGAELSTADRGRGLLLIDCAWRRVPTLQRRLTRAPLLRRLPPLVTAYPRKSKLFEDPAAGLASVEALYAAVHVLWGPRLDLLDEYRDRAAFLAANPWLSAPG
jgi:pre-rRNA-processing protein TSR3